MLDSVGSKLKENPLRTRPVIFQPNLLLSLWVLLRLPLFIAAIYFIWPDEFIWLITLLAIHLLGTIPERLALFALILAGLGGTFFATRKLPLRAWGRYLASLGVAFGLFLLLFSVLPNFTLLTAALFLTSVLAINIVSGTWLVNFMASKPGRWMANGIFAVVIGLTEMLLPKPLLLWLLWQWRGREAALSWANRRLIHWLPAVWVAGLGALLPSADSLATLHRSLFPDPAVQMFARGNFNWTELDLERRVLYAIGYEMNFLQAYTIDSPEQPPRISPVEDGYAQGFAYNPVDQELYIYNVLTQQLLVLDGVTLELKKSFSISQPLSPGDVWIAWDPFSDNLVIASEADEQKDVPTVVVARKTGQVLDRLNLDPGNISLHPHKPWLYMSFLRRINELLIYDMQRQQVIRRAPAPERFDRMIFAPGADGVELFASAPMDSQVWRFDAETLERKGAIKTLFGGRAIAVDPERHLLLCGSLVTHRLEVIDLTTQQRIAEYYLGPWLRTIMLDTKAGIAYLASHEGLFTIQYINSPSPD